MNRELKRAQARQDKKQEKAPTPTRRGARKQAKSPKIKGKTSPQQKKAPPRAARRGPRRINNRITGILAFVSAILISLQSLPTSQDVQASDYFFQGMAFFLFAYFLNLWQKRQDMRWSLGISLAAALLLAVSTQTAKVISGFPLETALINLGLAATGAIGGIGLSNLIFKHSPIEQGA